MNSDDKSRNIFADKASFVIRKMLSNPDKKWVIRDFVEREGVSIGMAQSVIEVMGNKGYIERVKSGPDSYSFLTNKENLLNDWLDVYKFGLNRIETYYTHDKNILSEFKKYLKDKQYALTLHSGANLITSFVITDHVYLYFKSQDWKKDILALRQRFDLKQLVRGGNIHIINPYYKQNVFYNIRAIKGYKVVSNLQLYLDLYNFKPRGQEHAEYLKKILEERGKKLYGS